MKKKLTALLVDDERLARKDMANLLAEHKNIQVTGEADSVATAIAQIKVLDPDIIFLDIQMPGESGFDLLNQCETQAQIVFVTAFDEFAIRAFEVNALDYLLKPVNPDRLARTIDRLTQEPHSPANSDRKLNYDDRLFLLLDNQMRFLKISTIICIQAAGDYSELVTTESAKNLTLKSMKEWEHRLPEQYFCRIHRSTIINMDFIDRMEEWFNYSYRVFLNGIEEPMVMSRRYVARLKQRMG